MSALNFDPYAALAEIQNGEGLRANRANRANVNRGLALAPLAPLALSPAQNVKTNGGLIAPVSTAWKQAIARLDTDAPPYCFALTRWRQLVEDARWLADRHGASGAALGWTASDLFGLDPALDGWGGLADRLEGARRVTLTDTVARWRSDELDGRLWRKTLHSMPKLWEFPLQST